MLDELPKPPPAPVAPAPTKKPDPKANPKSRVSSPTKPAPVLASICEKTSSIPVNKKKDEMQCSLFDLLSNEPGPEAKPIVVKKEKVISSARSDGYAEDSEDDEDNDESIYDDVIAKLEKEEMME